MKFIQYLGLAALLNCSFDLDSLRGRSDAAVERHDGGKIKMPNDLGSFPKDSGSGDTVHLPEDASVDMLTKDSGLPSEDARVREDLSIPDIGVDLPSDMNPSCYTNNFNEGSDLDNLVIQNGVWSRDADGYLKQTEGGIGGWRITYLNDAVFSDFEARIMVRMREDPSVEVGVDHKHTGLLFRYTRGSKEDYDRALDHGYVLQMELFTGSGFEFTLEDLATREIETTHLDCGYVSCQNDNWYELMVRAVGGNITAYWEGEEIFSVVDVTYSSGRIGFACYAFAESHFEDLEVCEE